MLCTPQVHDLPEARGAALRMPNDLPARHRRILRTGLARGEAPERHARRAAGARRLTVLRSMRHACGTKRIVAMRGRRPYTRATMRSMVSPSWPPPQQHLCSCPVRLVVTLLVPSPGSCGVRHSAPPSRSLRKKSSSSCISCSALSSSSRRGRGALSPVAS